MVYSSGTNLIKRMRKRKRVRFRTIELKLSPRQKQSLENYCQARHTTPVKLIKKCIRKYTEGFARSVPDEYYVTEKQLALFDETEKTIADQSPAEGIKF